jgi:CGNR zinc finger
VGRSHVADLSSESAATGLNNGLVNAPIYVFDRADAGEPVAPGQLRIGAMAHTLEAVCYLNLAFTLAERQPIDVCPACQSIFIPTDGRQKYCTPACGNRARVKKFISKQSSGKAGSRLTVSADTNGVRRGKKTRTR